MKYLSTLSEGWTLSKIPTNGRANQGIHYKSPKPKQEFKSYHIAREFDRMQVKHPEGEESAESEEEVCNVRRQACYLLTIFIFALDFVK